MATVSRDSNVVSVDVSDNAGKNASWQATPLQVETLNKIASVLPRMKMSELIDFALFKYNKNKEEYQAYKAKQEGKA